MAAISRPRAVRPGMALAALGLAIGVWWMPWQVLSRPIYDGLRGFAVWRQERALDQDHRIRTPHFLIYYQGPHRREAKLVARLVNAAYPFESKNLGVRIQNPIPVVIANTTAALNLSVGLPAADNNLGLYWEGVIRVLSPDGWLGPSPATFEEYAADGPVAHELGHALLNLKADGNYPAWFNEGVAQWEDWKVTGYRWIAPQNALTGRLYPLKELTRGFYNLPNQALAYREGLGLVAFLLDHSSVARWHRFLVRLGSGSPFPRALQAVYGYRSPAALFGAWRATLTHRGPGSRTP